MNDFFYLMSKKITQNTKVPISEKKNKIGSIRPIFIYVILKNKKKNKKKKKGTVFYNQKPRRLLKNYLAKKIKN